MPSFTYVDSRPKSDVSAKGLTDIDSDDDDGEDDDDDEEDEEKEEGEDREAFDVSKTNIVIY